MSKKICFVTTVSMTVDQFIRFSFEGFHNDGYDISVICDMDEVYVNTLPKYVKAFPIKMSRGINFKEVFRVIAQMYRIFKKEKFDLIQYSTPNASFYASIASWLVKVPIRLYCQWGLVFQSFSGIKRFVFKTIERMVCLLSTDVQPDSPGNLNLCRNLNFYGDKKSRVVWNGSANGICLSKFDISQKDFYRSTIRQKHNIAHDAFVVGFVGRVGKEKGFEELMQMFNTLLAKYPDIYLLYVGPNEKPETVSNEALEFFDICDRIIYTGGWVDDTERYYAAMDVFVFPTYHEGFGSVTIEAEAMGIPVIVSDVPGPQDAMIDTVTGFKVPSKNVEKLVEKVSLFIEERSLCEKMGLKAREFVANNFDDRVLIEKILENRNFLIHKKSKKN